MPQCELRFWVTSTQDALQGEWKESAVECETKKKSDMEAMEELYEYSYHIYTD